MKLEDDQEEIWKVESAFHTRYAEEVRQSWLAYMSGFLGAF
jgi:hypothetical protein